MLQAPRTLAYRFDQAGVRQLGVGLRIVNRDGNFQVPDIGPPEAFDDVQRFALGMRRSRVNPAPVKAGCVQ